MHNEDNNNMPAPGSAAPDAESAPEGLDPTLALKLQNDQQAQQIAELKQRLNAKDEELALTKAQRDARHGATGHDAKEVSAAIKRQDITRLKVSSEMGNARWHALPVERRMQALGFNQTISEADVVEAKRVFGGSDSRAAVEMHKYNPSRYVFLRALNREANNF